MLSGIGGFKVPDWAENILPHKPADPGPTAGAPAPARPDAAQKGVRLPSASELWSKLGGPGKSDSTGRAGWLQAKGERAARDVTARFQQLEKTAATGQSPLPADAKNYVYLEVGGLFTERYP